MHPLFHGVEERDGERRSLFGLCDKKCVVGFGDYRCPTIFSPLSRGALEVFVPFLAVGNYDFQTFFQLLHIRFVDAERSIYPTVPLDDFLPTDDSKNAIPRLPSNPEIVSVLRHAEVVPACHDENHPARLTTLPLGSKNQERTVQQDARAEI